MQRKPNIDVNSTELTNEQMNRKAKTIYLSAWMPEVKLHPFSCSLLFHKMGILTQIIIIKTKSGIYYRDQPWFSVFKHSMDHEEGV